MKGAGHVIAGKTSDTHRKVYSRSRLSYRSHDRGSSCDEVRSGKINTSSKYTQLVRQRANNAEQQHLHRHTVYGS